MELETILKAIEIIRRSGEWRSKQAFYICINHKYKTASVKFYTHEKQ